MEAVTRTLACLQLLPSVDPASETRFILAKVLVSGLKDAVTASRRDGALGLEPGTNDADSALFKQNDSLTQAVALVLRDGTRQCYTLVSYCCPAVHRAFICSVHVVCARHVVHMSCALHVTADIATKIHQDSSEARFIE